MPSRLSRRRRRERPARGHRICFPVSPFLGRRIEATRSGPRSDQLGYQELDPRQATGRVPSRAKLDSFNAAKLILLVTFAARRIKVSVEPPPPPYVFLQEYHSMVVAS